MMTAGEKALPREIRITSAFKKNVKEREKLFHSRFFEAVYLLMYDKDLPESFHDHSLVNTAFRECHIHPDWLLVYQKKDNLLILVFLTNHNDLQKFLNKQP